MVESRVDAAVTTQARKSLAVPRIDGRDPCIDKDEADKILAMITIPSVKASDGMHAGESIRSVGTF